MENFVIEYIDGELILHQVIDDDTYPIALIPKYNKWAIAGMTFTENDIYFVLDGDGQFSNTDLSYKILRALVGSPQYKTFKFRRLYAKLKCTTCENIH